MENQANTAIQADKAKDLSRGMGSVGKTVGGGGGETKMKKRH